MAYLKISFTRYTKQDCSRKILSIAALTHDMADLVYAVREQRTTITDFEVLEVKIGRTTSLKNRLRTFQTFSRNAEILRLWKLNPHKDLNKFEKGVLKIAESFAYKRESENFIFLEDQFQEFANAMNWVASPTSLKEVTSSVESEYDSTNVEATETESYIGTTPYRLRFEGQEYEVNTWRDGVREVARYIIQNSENPDRITEIRGRKRPYFIDDERSTELRAPKNIPDTNFHFEGKRNADRLYQTMERLAEKFGYDTSRLEVELEEER